MVSDIASNYTSPAGKEFTLAAGKIAGINPSSTVLDMGCGYGEGACNLAEQFRCRVTALDSSPENLKFAGDLAVQRGVSHLITFTATDILAADYAESPFELALAEGGVLSFVGRKRGLALAAQWLAPRGWFAFSDLVVLSEKVPDEVRAIFEDDKYRYESEASYRTLVKENGFDVFLASLVPHSGWDNYYAHMARRLEDETGFFADRRIKLAFHKEIDVFYRLEGFRYVGYLFCIVRKRE